MQRLFTLTLLLLLASGMAKGQEAVETDSVLVMGLVVDHLSGEPLQMGHVHFLRSGDTVASYVCDTEGVFVSDRLPVGTYALCVEVKGLSLYQADLMLNSNAQLCISVITDSFQFRRLREVAVVAPRHRLAEQGQLITHYDDPRLWDFMNRPCWGTEAHYGGADAGFKPGRFYAPAKGRKDDRIWQIFWPDHVTTAPQEEESKARSEERRVGKECL